MKTLLVIFAFAIFSIHSFSQETVVQTGNFGGDGKNAPKLELKSDHSFSYTDLTKASKPIVFTGTWSMEKGKLVLSSPSSINRKAMTEFTVKSDGNCLKARKGMAFYSLCNCN